MTGLIISFRLALNVLFSLGDIYLFLSYFGRGNTVSRRSDQFPSLFFFLLLSSASFLRLSISPFISRLVLSLRRLPLHILSILSFP